MGMVAENESSTPKYRIPAGFLHEFVATKICKFETGIHKKSFFQLIFLFINRFKGSDSPKKKSPELVTAAIA